MLDLKEDRQNYSKLLKPPHEYEVDKILTTSYSLDMDTLIGICISLGLEAEIEDEIIERPICMLQALEKMSKKIIVICQTGKIFVPKKEAKLYAILESMIYTINQENGVFHPKLWLLRYKNKKNNKIKYRLIVASKNLTFDRSWDTQISLDGDLEKEKIIDNSVLINFLKFIEGSIEKQKRNNTYHVDNILNEFIKELPQVVFDTSLNNILVNSTEFIHFGSTGAKIEFFEKGNYKNVTSALIISPFIKIEVLNNLANKLVGDEKLKLITRKEELTEKLLENEKIETFIINQHIYDGEYGIEEDEEEPQHQDIHSKIFLINEGKDTHFYIGSANATNSAFYRNTEVMLHLNIPSRYKLLETIKKELLEKEEDDENSYFVKATKEEVLHTEEKNDEELQKLQKDFFKLNSIAIVTNIKDKYDISIKFTNYSKILLDGYYLKIKPLLNNNISFEIDENIEFKGLELKDISEFYIIEFYKQNELLDKIVIKVPTENLPNIDDRISLIATDIIKDKKDFLEYLAFILSDNYLYGLLESYRNSSKKAGMYNGEYVPALYEKMLKILSNDSERIKEIEKLMKYTKNNKNVIPDGFTELYNEFKKVVKDFE